MGKKLFALIAAVMLVMGLAGTALAWQPDMSQECVDGASITTVTLHADTSPSEYSLGGNDGPWTEYKDGKQIKVEGSATLWTRQAKQDDKDATDKPERPRWEYQGPFEIVGMSCPKPPPDAPKVEVAGCDVIDGTGSITISGLAEGGLVKIRPTGDTFESDGTYKIDPGKYAWSFWYDGERVGELTVFTVGACPEPPPTGSIEFVKVISGEDKGPGFDWAFNITGPGLDKDTGVGTLDGLALGAYTVAEVNIPDNYKFVGVVCEPKQADSKSAGDNVATLSEDALNWVCTFTNEYVPPVEPTVPEVTAFCAEDGQSGIEVSGLAGGATIVVSLVDSEAEPMTITEDGFYGLAPGDYTYQYNPVDGPSDTTKITVGVCPTPTPSVAPTPAPSDEITPPPTDTISNTSGPSGPGSGLWLVLAGLTSAAFVATLVVAPKRK
jgi:hypothetical protein